MSSAHYNAILITLCLFGILFLIFKWRVIISKLQKIFNATEFKALSDKNLLLKKELDLMAEHEEVLKSKLTLLEYGERSLGFGVWSWDMTKVPDQVSFSKNFAAIFDIAEDKVVDAKYLMSVIHVDDRELVNKQLQEAFEKQRSYVIEYRVVRRNDRNDRVRATGIPVLNQNKKVIKINGTIQLLAIDVP